MARCRPREGCGLHHKRNLLEDQIEAHLVAVPVRGAGCIPHGKQELQGQELHHFSVPVRGAGCIGVVRKKNNFITLLPSPRGVRVASKNDCCTRRRANVAVPARGAGCIHEVLCGNLRLYVAVPARGAGCITKACEAWLKEHALPSPRGVRVASSLCSMTSTSTTTSCRPREGCGLHRN